MEASFPVATRLSFRQAPLLDAYDVYQHLMDYWAETMQDDTYLIVADGWVKGAQPREIVQVKDKNNKLTWPEPVVRKYSVR